jgi:AAA+ ATPase superfamily predicted ATPase
MMDTILLPDSPFLNEGRDLLVSEFGKEYNTYFSILQLIATERLCKAKLTPSSEEHRCLPDESRKRVFTDMQEQTHFCQARSRKARWSIRDNFLQFWFRFLFPNQSLVEMGKLDCSENTWTKITIHTVASYLKNTFAT